MEDQKKSFSNKSEKDYIDLNTIDHMSTVVLTSLTKVKGNLSQGHKQIIEGIRPKGDE